MNDRLFARTPNVETTRAKWESFTPDGGWVHRAVSPMVIDVGLTL